MILSCMKQKYLQFSVNTEKYMSKEGDKKVKLQNYEL